MYARFAITDHQSLQMWMHNSKHTMVTLRICFVRFVSKFLKLQHHTCVIIERALGKEFLPVFQMLATVFNFQRENGAQDSVASKV